MARKIRRKVTQDFTLMIGGPNGGERRILAVFRAGQKLKLRRVSPKGQSPVEYRIKGHPDAGCVSRGVLRQFLNID